MNLIYLFAFIFSSLLLASPHSISQSYNTCVNCHYNAFGGGPLTDYGRAYAATVLGQHRFVKSELSDEQLALISGFLGAKKLPKWFRPHANYRGIVKESNMFKVNNKGKFETWQANAGLTFKFGQYDRFVATGTVDYDSGSELGGGKNRRDYHPITSREYYLSYRFGDSFKMYTGFMNKIFGLNFFAPNLLYRQSMMMGLNDQTHGMAFHFNNSLVDGGIHLYNGNMNRLKVDRQRGGSFKFQVQTSKNSRTGVSMMYSNGKKLTLMAVNTHLRMSFDEGNSLLIETGLTQKLFAEETPLRNINFYNTFQARMKLSRGIYVLTGFEFFREDILKTSDIQIKLTPGLAYYPAQRLKLTAEVSNYRIISNSSIPPEQWNFLGQLHLWL